MRPYDYELPCRACDSPGRGRGLSATERVRRCQQLEDHAHQKVLDAMQAPVVNSQRRARLKATYARAGLAGTLVAVAALAVALFETQWWLIVIAGVAALLAVQWFRRASILAESVTEEDDKLGDAMRGHAAAVLDREEAERRRDIGLDPGADEVAHAPGCKTKRQTDARERMLQSLRPAARAEYIDLLDAWTRKGRPIRHSDCPMGRRIFVATGRLHVEPLHGVHALDVIIVPDGVEVTGSEPGHTDVVWADMSRSLTFHGGPVRDLTAYIDAHPALAGVRGSDDTTTREA